MDDPIVVEVRLWGERVGAVADLLCRNCDDHTKNVSFLMRPTGRWELAPAYDLCFAHNPAPGRWTRQHQMLVAGKAQGIAKADLVELGERFDLRRPEEKCGRGREVPGAGLALGPRSPRRARASSRPVGSSAG
jgi:hypothetical protein